MSAGERAGEGAEPVACQNLASLASLLRMGTMNISLPESLKAFVDRQVSARGYGTSSEYVRELIRRDQERLELKTLLLAGAASAPAGRADEAWFARLRGRARTRKPKR